MNRQTIGVSMENYDVVMLAGHNVMYYSDSLKGGSVHKSFESHSKDVQNSHFDLSSIVLARFSSKFTKPQWQKEREQTCMISSRVIIACIFAHQKSGSLISPKRESQHKSEISINFSVYAYMSKNLQIESTTFRARIMNYNQLAGSATMCFEWQTDFGRWVKFSCITMSLLY